MVLAATSSAAWTRSSSALSFRGRQRVQQGLFNSFHPVSRALRITAVMVRAGLLQDKLVLVTGMAVAASQWPVSQPHSSF